MNETDQTSLDIWLEGVPVPFTLLFDTLSRARKIREEIIYAAAHPGQSDANRIWIDDFDEELTFRLSRLLAMRIYPG